MNTLYKLLVTLIITSSILQAKQTIIEHMHQYAVDHDVASILDKHSNELYKKLMSISKNGGQHGVWQFSWLPGYYVKYGLSRIWGMEIMQQVIDEHTLDLLWLPDKRIYHLNGRPTQVNNTNYCVVVKKVKADPHSKPVTQEQIKQMSTIIRKTKYISYTHDNYLLLKDGTI